jgi:hypothetical protein
MSFIFSSIFSLFRGIGRRAKVALFHFWAKGDWVVLSSGIPVRIRQLELYELDNVPYEDVGPYRHPYLINGQIREQIHDVSQWEEVPKKPKKGQEECEPGSIEEAQWQLYNTYQAALSHRLKQVELTEKWSNDVARYILKNCVSESDRQYIIEPEDYTTIYHAVIVPEVRLEDIERVLRSTFPGELQQSVSAISDIEETTEGEI